MEELKLFMVLLGCKPAGRNIEQHDIFFSVGSFLKNIVPDILNFWNDAGTIHIDAWREITEADGFKIKIVKQDAVKNNELRDRLFFLNLGGYKAGEFEEYHYKLLAIGKEKKDAINLSKKTAFFKHTGFKGAEAHIDDKYGIDVDDVYEIKDILPRQVKENYAIEITPSIGMAKDEWHLGYTILNKLVDKKS